MDVVFGTHNVGSRFSCTRVASRGGLLREDALQDAANGWLGHVYDRKNRDRTIAALTDSQEPVVQIGRDAAKKRLAEAEAKLTRFQNAIIAGVDPAALVEAINESQAERLVSRAALDNFPAPVEVDVAEICAAIDSIGDVSAALRGSAPTNLEELYEARDLQVQYKQNPTFINERHLKAVLNDYVSTATIVDHTNGATTRHRNPTTRWETRPTGAHERVNLAEADAAQTLKPSLE